ncbi:hypothetical protein HYY75_06075 [bacterium]|nr:hypothetical protein [bacterium]
MKMKKIDSFGFNVFRFFFGTFLMLLLSLRVFSAPNSLGDSVEIVADVNGNSIEGSIEIYEDPGFPKIENIRVVPELPSNFLSQTALNSIFGIQPAHTPYSNVLLLGTLIGPQKILVDPPESPPYELFLKTFTKISTKGITPNNWPLPDIPTKDPYYDFFSIQVSAGWQYLVPPTLANINGQRHFLCNCQREPCPAPCSQDGFGVWTHAYPNDNAHWCVNGNQVLSTIQSANGLARPGSDPDAVIFEIRIKDRTPPHICDLNGVENPAGFPDLYMAPNPGATTGDFNRMNQLKFWDNSPGSNITTHFAVGVVNGPGLPETWVWAGDAQICSNNGVPSYVFMPNQCYGAMRYSVFAWDAIGNLNPGAAKIEEDRPDLCYGLSNFGAFPDLNSGPGSPLPFPYSGTNADFAGGFPLCYGNIQIDDNDFPNIFVKVVSMKEKNNPLNPKYAFCFPPPSADLISIDPGIPAKLLDGAFLTYEELQNPGQTPYFKVLSADCSNAPAPENTAAENNFLSDANYQNRNFRLESFATSDTDTNGDLIVNDPNSFGNRHGFGKSTVLFCQIPLVEDVEHQLWVYAEDNVKVAAPPIPSPFTGIKSLSFRCYDSNQFPPLDSKKLNGPPTVALLDGNGNPWIEVEATDVKGNSRKMKIFFEVTDEKAKIRVLEQKLLKQ